MRNLLRLIIRYYFFFLFLLLEVVSVTLLVQKNTFHRARFINISRSIEGSFYETFGVIREYLVLKETNQDLHMENTLLRNQLDGLTRKQEQSAELRYDYVPRRQFSYIPALVINASTNKQFNFITLDKGRNHGIEPEMAVISPKGVVGIVYSVSGNYSSVIPLVNRDLRLSAKIRRNGYFGSLSWPGSGYDNAILEEIPFHVDLRHGDTIVTSGYSAIFPEGIIVGTVEEFEAFEGNFYTITVDLAVDYKNLSHINVIRNLMKEEQLELERVR
ncbi:MAG TPA: rod shape-determining protein MreC [Bacteroides sp.]|nr:rod shape-determining protein MreC [Bacteroides sp.]